MINLAKQLGLKLPELIIGHGPPTDNIGKRNDVYIDIDQPACYEAKGDSWYNPIPLVEKNHPLLFRVMLILYKEEQKKKKRSNFPIPSTNNPDTNYPIPSEENRHD